MEQSSRRHYSNTAGRGSRGGRGHPYAGRGGSASRGGYTTSASGSREGGARQLINLQKYMDKKIKVKFMGGKEVDGELKGYDQLLNIVLDNAVQIIKCNDGGESDNLKNLGLVVIRGPTVALVSPLDGTEEIENPFEHQ